MFTAALFTIARTWKQPRCPRQMNGYRNCGTYVQWNITAIKENTFEVDEPRAYCTEWTKSERERQILYINACVQNLEEWYWWACFLDRKGVPDIENRLWTQQEKGRVRRTKRVAWKIYTVMCKTDSQWEFAVRHREGTRVLFDSLEGWDAVGDSRGRGHMAVADSRWW